MPRIPDDDALDPVLRRAAETLREPVAGPVDMPARVRQAARRRDWHAAISWALEPRSIRVAPLGMAALAAGIAVLVLVGRNAPAAAPAPSVPASVVRFAVHAPGASTVALVGDFNDWDARATPLRSAVGDDGLWTIEVPLSAGRHEYAFVVDGTDWRATANATPNSDDFGRPNAVVFVTRSS
jgi:hypothetical protein